MSEDNESFSGQAVRGAYNPPPKRQWGPKLGPPETWQPEMNAYAKEALAELAGVPEFLRKPAPPPETGTNPKTLMGRLKVPMLSVIPPTALVYLGMALRNGAYEAPRADGGKGYGPYNWRDQPVEASTYVDAAFRHIAEFWDGQDVDPKSLVPHLAHAMATLAILVDAIENETCKDDRPNVRHEVMSKILQRETRSL